MAAARMLRKDTDQCGTGMSFPAVDPLTRSDFRVRLALDCDKSAERAAKRTEGGACIHHKKAEHKRVMGGATCDEDTCKYGIVAVVNAVT